MRENNGPSVREAWQLLRTRSVRNASFDCASCAQRATRSLQNARLQDLTLSPKFNLPAALDRSWRTSWKVIFQDLTLTSRLGTLPQLPISHYVKHYFGMLRRNA